MIWLLRLYPRPWRQRYGDEVAAMLAGRPFSFAVAVDLVAGAIDVWLHPSATLAAATAASRQKERAMPEVTNADQWKAGGMMVGLTLALTLIWMYAHIRIGDNPYVDSLSIMPFMVAALFSMRYTYLKQRAASVQAVFIGGLSLAIAALMLAAGWISAQI
jgi:hypothetical protein